MPGRFQKSYSGKQTKHQVGRSKVSKEADFDLSKPMFPLDHYLNDRSELLEQMFVSLTKGSHLQVTMPDILKDLPTEELKRLCLSQLEVMSKKRIRKILAGIEMESSSGTDDSDENEADSKPTAKDPVSENSVAMDTCQQPADSTVLEGHLAVPSPKESDERSSPIAEDEVQATSDCEEQLPGSPGGGTTCEDMLELHPDSVYGSPAADAAPDSIADEEEESIEPEMESESQSPEPENVVSEEVVDVLQAADPSVSIARTCMEIFELELRARAIKSLLKTQNSENPLPQ